MTSYTDAQILEMNKVTPQVAAAYLGLDVRTLRDGLIQGVFPFGVAMVTNGSQRTCFDIRPQALVEYNRHGCADRQNIRLFETILERLDELN